MKQMLGRSDLIIENEWLEAGRVKTDGVTGEREEIEGVAVKEEWAEGHTVKVTTVQIRTAKAE